MVFRVRYCAAFSTSPFSLESVESARCLASPQWCEWTKPWPLTVNRSDCGRSYLMHLMLGMISLKANKLGYAGGGSCMMLSESLLTRARRIQGLRL